MRLTLPVSKFKPYFQGYIPKYPGHLTTGKRRWVPPVRIGHRMTFFYELADTQSAMNVLAKPYISKDQETALLQHQGRTKPEYWNDFMWKTYHDLPKHKFGAHYLTCLDRTAKFEEED